MPELDDRLAEGLASSAAYEPVATELVPEFRRRLARRRRRVATGNVAVVLAVLAVGIVVVDGDDDDGPSVTAGSTTSTSVVTTTTTGVGLPGEVDYGLPLRVEDVRLPDEGIVVEVDAVGVVLVGLDGQVIGHLPGFDLNFDPGSGGARLLRHDEQWFVLADGRVRNVPVVDEAVAVPLAYGAEKVVNVLRTPGGSWVRRDGRTVFDIGTGLDSISMISYDHDVVSREEITEGTANRAIDLRTGRITDLPSHCGVADRHGARWYYICWEESSGRRFVAVGSPGDPSPSKLVGEARAGSGAKWVSVMVSPDGSQLLLQWSGECEVQEVWFAATATGRLVQAFPGERVVMAEAHGWTADGRAVVSQVAQPGCAEQTSPGVYLLGEDGPELVYRLPQKTSRVALWSPVLR